MSKVNNLLHITKNTNYILENILKSMYGFNSKNNDISILHKSTAVTMFSVENTEYFPLKKIDLLISEIIYEMLDYHKMSQSLSAFTSESNIQPLKINQLNILNKLGIKDKFNNENIVPDLQIPIIYFILFYFMNAVKNDYKNILDLFTNSKNDIVNNCEKLLTNDNINNEDVNVNNSLNTNININTDINNDINNNNDINLLYSPIKKELDILFSNNSHSKKGILRSSFSKSKVNKKPVFVDSNGHPLGKIKEEKIENKSLNASTKELTKVKADENDNELEFSYSTKSIKSIRAISVKKKAFKPKRKTRNEHIENNENAKQSEYFRKTYRQKDLKNIMMKDVIIKTDEEKLKKLLECPFIEPTQIY